MLRMLVALLLAMLSFPAAAQETIEAYGVPPSLLGPPCQAVPYAPVEVFRAPEGKPLGQLVLDHPEYVKETQPSCTELPLVMLQIEEYYAPVSISEWGYETNGIELYALTPVANDPTHMWGQARADGREIWLKLPVSEIHTYEDLATLPQDFSVVCTTPGQCAPASAEFLDDIARSEGQVQSCYEEAYTITGRATVDDKRYYELTRQELNGGAAAFPHLPEKIYIPTRNSEGGHTGYFYPRGC